MRSIISIILFIPILVSCSGSESAIKRHEPSNVTRLTPAMIFSGDIVKNFKVADDSLATQANQLFMKGVDEFRNKKNPDAAIDLFVQSICLNPLSQYYFELGNASIETKHFDKALSAYQMAEKLGFEPFSKILYNYACIYSLKEDDEKSAYYLEASLQAGYSNLAQIRKDKDLAFLRKKEWRFESAMREGMKGMTNPERLFWLQFRKSFANLKTNFALDGMKQQFKEKDQISFEYESYVAEMRNTKYSREVDRLFYAVGEIATGSDVVALIYAEADAWTENPFYVYRLATFDKEGKLLDKKVIAGREKLTELLTAKFSSGRNLAVSSFDLIYKKDVEEVGYTDNPIQSKTPTGTVTYTIGDDGSISARDIVAVD